MKNGKNLRKLIKYLLFKRQGSLKVFYQRKTVNFENKKHKEKKTNLKNIFSITFGI